MQEIPEPGAVLLDGASKRVGEVVSAEGPVVRLRRPGGLPWMARLADCEPASASEELSSKVAQANAGWGVTSGAGRREAGSCR
ncbi:hypothetical protein [Streptomyces sp. NPDC093261]|uniref:hypothetical protein n=1 Tax=Streptomyces sp. NPDC093261 TaxID=3366037 RepID=UPI0038186355